jgi:hypothetical protein
MVLIMVGELFFFFTLNFEPTPKSVFHHNLCAVAYRHIVQIEGT